MITQNVFSFIQDRYQLHEKLGEGSMGVVYRAYDRFMDQIVALKRVTISAERIDFSLRASVGSDGDYRLALAHEFKTLASLRHPHIISVLDYGFDSGRQPYYTMDLLEDSQTLFEAGKAQSEKGKVNLLIQLLQALTYLHRRNILHRDLKPANVLVSAGQIKVLDFGLASAVQDDSKTVGTWAYMAPEVMQGKPSSRSTDLYAVGVIAYQLLTGHYPYAFRTPSQLLNRVMTVQPDCSAIENPNLSEIISLLLEKEPSARYASAEEIIPVLSDAVDQPPPQESIAIRESFLRAAQFVGRERELSTLIDAMDGAAQGRGAVWMISGESGVGKSRLVDELRTHAMVEGAAILRGQAVEGGGLPYQLWRDPVRRLALSVELSDFEAGIVREWVPDIDALLGRSIPKVPILDGKANSQRLGATILDIIRRQVRRQPTLLILEDLQWAVEGLEVLKLLIRAVGDLPLLIVGTYQSDVSPYLISELPGAQVMTLGRLSESAIGQLSAQMLGENGRDPDVVGFLQEQTEGNVFFLVEVVRALAESAGRLSEIGTSTLPESVFTGGINDIIQRRLNHISEEDQAFLRLAAIIGRALDLNILRTLASPDRLDKCLLNGTSAGVLEVQQGRWSFAHDKLREALIIELEDQERAQLHRRAAETIETVYEGDERYASQLLRHWRSAGDLQKEMHYTCIASQQALSMSFYREVLELGERMFERLERCDKIPIDSGQKSLLLNLMGEAASSMGNYDRAWQNFEAALAQASAQDDLHNVAMARHGLGVIALSRADYEAAEKYFTQSLEISREIDDQQRIIANLYQIGILNRYRGDYEKAHTYYNQSIKIAREIGDRFGMAKCLNSLGVLAIFQSDYKTAKSYYEQSLAIQKEINDRSGMATSLFNLGNTTENQGEYAQSLSYHEQALNMFREIGDLQGEAYCVRGLGNLNIYKGAYQVSLTYLEEGLSLWQQLGNQRGVASCLKSLGWLALKQGKWESARRYSERSLALYKEIGYVFGIGLALSGLGELAYMQGDNDTSETYIRNSMEIYHKLNSQSAISRCYIILGRIAYDRKQFNVAREYYETSLAICHEIDEISTRALGQCQLGFVYIALSDAEAARRSLCDALSIAHRIGMMPLVLEILIGFAKLYWLEGKFNESMALVQWANNHSLAEVDKNLQRRLEAFRADSKVKIETRTINSGELDSESIVEKILATCTGAL